MSQNHTVELPYVHCISVDQERDLKDDTWKFYHALQQQYKFVHECLSCVLEGREDEATYANIGQVNVGFEGKQQHCTFHCTAYSCFGYTLMQCRGLFTNTASNTTLLLKLQ